jgi:hypothetical protein
MSEHFTDRAREKNNAHSTQGTMATSIALLHTNRTNFWAHETKRLKVKRGGESHQTAHVLCLDVFFFLGLLTRLRERTDLLAESYSTGMLLPGHYFVKLYCHFPKFGSEWVLRRQGPMEKGPWSRVHRANSAQNNTAPDEAKIEIGTSRWSPRVACQAVERSRCFPARHRPKNFQLFLPKNSYGL